MTTEEFWQLIEKSKAASGKDYDKQAAWLVDELAKLSVEDILDYSRICDELLDRSYHQDLRDAARMINFSFGIDGFSDFRAWLIGQGQVIYENALADPETLADSVDEGQETFAEALLFVDSRAYERKTGESQMPFSPRVLPKLLQSEFGSLGGLRWEEYEKIAPQRFPKLYAKFDTYWQKIYPPIEE